MIRFSYFFSLLIFSLISIYYNDMSAQSTIAKQSFESSGDTWAPLTLSTPACIVGDDVWNFSTGIGVVFPNEGMRFWGIADLNGNCGGSGFETITLPNVNVSAYNNVTLQGVNQQHLLVVLVL